MRKNELRYRKRDQRLSSESKTLREMQRVAPRFVSQGAKQSKKHFGKVDLMV